AACGEHHDRRGRGLSQPPAHLVTVDDGQHQVEHHEVGLLRLGQPQRLGAVACPFDLVAALLQIPGDDLGDGLVVVDDEHQAVLTHHINLTVAWTPRATATCAANHQLDNPVHASTTHGANASQIRSTSPRVTPDRSSTATASSAAPTSSQARRCRNRASPTAVAGPVMIANSARFAYSTYSYGRLEPDPNAHLA